ncbi:MAG: hypothetical protein M1835_000006 [Candelina submexicana]|nr:MAG: hypothetical protein M1835_000006 [Candelina submexicana]
MYEIPYEITRASPIEIPYPTYMGLSEQRDSGQGSGQMEGDGLSPPKDGIDSSSWSAVCHGRVKGQGCCCPGAEYQDVIVAETGRGGGPWEMLLGVTRDVMKTVEKIGMCIATDSGVGTLTTGAEVTGLLQGQS